MVLQIRNMESARCVTLVKSELDKLGIVYKKVELGKAELNYHISEHYLNILDIALKECGLELIMDKYDLLIDKVKAVVHELVYLSDELPKPIFSEFIRKKVDHDYTSLSILFSSLQGITIDKYIIIQKIERVKELLVYSELSINDIAFKLQYSSVAHLSNQFKKVTGLTPSFFRQRRNTLHR
jgi:AraC-like DNA-binding protein